MPEKNLEINQPVGIMKIIKYQWFGKVVKTKKFDYLQEEFGDLWMRTNRLACQVCRRLTLRSFRRLLILWLKNKLDAQEFQTKARMTNIAMVCSLPARSLSYDNRLKIHTYSYIWMLNVIISSAKITEHTRMLKKYSSFGSKTLW